MCELLVKAKTTYTNPDAEKDRVGTYKIGYPVVSFEDGHSWGGAEGLPDFIIIKVKNTTVVQMQDYLAVWRMDIKFSIVSSDTATDTFRIDAESDKVNNSGTRGNITQAMVEDVLDGWDIEGIVDTGTNYVRFDIIVRKAIFSPAFWVQDITNVGFTETSYNSSTGVHTVEVDYIDADNWDSVAIKKQLEAGGGTFVSDINSITTFTITRQTLYNEFVKGVKFVADQTGVYRRQYYFPSTLVSDIIDSGGTQIYNNLAQMTARLKNKIDD